MSSRKRTKIDEKYKIGMSKQLMERKRIKKKPTTQRASNNHVILVDNRNNNTFSCSKVSNEPSPSKPLTREVCRQIHRRESGSSSYSGNEINSDSDSTIMITDLTTLPILEDTFSYYTFRNPSINAEIIDLTYEITPVVSVNISTPIFKNKILNTVTKENCFEHIDCSICRDRIDFNILATTDCGHVFCLPCIQRHLGITKNCPICTKMLFNLGYHRIFPIIKDATNMKEKSLKYIECLICQECIDYNTTISTNCGHIFCEPCIKNNIGHGLNKHCPKCAKKLSDIGYHRIFPDVTI